jgi:2-polyprenyl-3-methyl-5-hydroxy-6-metoxy-1,4-benzoquinol methylase
MSERFYTGGAYLQLNPDWHVADSPWKASKIVEMMRRNSLAPRSVAEIGCGAGEILAKLHELLPVHTVFRGYDISPQAYSLAISRSKERLDFEHGDLLKLDVPRYDLMLCIDVFEHVDDYLGFLRGLHRKARHTIFHIPLNLSAQSVLRGKPIMLGRKKLGHIHYFFKDTALATLEDSGYRIIDFFYTAGSLERPASTVKNWLLRIPRRIAFAINRDFAVRSLGGYSLMVLAEPAEG